MSVNIRRSDCATLTSEAHNALCDGVLWAVSVSEDFLAYKKVF